MPTASPSASTTARRRSGDFVVGADGINSRVRAIMLPDGPRPEFTGLVGAGGFVPRSAIPIGAADEQTMVLHFARAPSSATASAAGRATRQAFWWTALERERPLTEEERRAFSLAQVRSALFASGQDVGRFGRAHHRRDHDLRSAAQPLRRRDPATLVGKIASCWSATPPTRSARTPARAPRSRSRSPCPGAATPRPAGNAEPLRSPPSRAERRERCEKIVAYGRRSGNAKKKRDRWQRGCSARCCRSSSASAASISTGCTAIGRSGRAQ